MKQSLPLSSIRIDDSYWNRFTKLIPEKVIPYQWDVLNDCQSGAPPSHCLKNFRIAAGDEEGRQQGMLFQDSDAAKWLEAVAYSLAVHPDPELEKNADDVIDLIGRAQEEDGYIDTYFTLNYPGRRWKNLRDGHELYCAGHLIEAAAAYFESTGKKKLLDIACKCAGLICKTFGPEDGKIHGYPGHPEIELALVRLYHVTGESRYLDMAKYFIDTRGGTPNYFIEERNDPDYIDIWGSRFDPKQLQSHLPVREQDTAEGHAVRALYLYSAMADIARETNDAELLERCRALWNNIVQKRMYITGSVGSSGFLERFTVDYDLPNDSNYSETCASIALAMFGERMAKACADASYFDIVELALYNSVRSGISLEGDRYFYVNPMEVWPQTCIENVSRSFIKPVRQKWFECACCPTNVARTFTNLGHYIYFKDEDELFVNLFIQNNVSFDVHGKKVNLSLVTDYPKTGRVKITTDGDGAVFTLNIRVPSYADDFSVTINGSAARSPLSIKNNYCQLKNVRGGDEVIVTFTVKPRVIFANPKVHYNCGRAAIARGPEIYCLEECDNGGNLAALSFDTSAPLTESWRDDLLGGIMTIKAKGKRLIEPDEAVSFSEKFTPRSEDAELSAVPYGIWCNRSPGEMLVWIRHT